MTPAHWLPVAAWSDYRRHERPNREQHRLANRAVELMVDARPVLLTPIGEDVFILGIGDTTLALNYVDLQALRYEINDLER